MTKISKPFVKYFIGKDKNDIRIFWNENHIEPIISSYDFSILKKMLRDYRWELPSIYGKDCLGKGGDNDPAKGTSTRFPFPYISTKEDYDTVKLLQRELAQGAGYGGDLRDNILMSEKEMEIEINMFIESIEKICGVKSKEYGMVVKIFSEFSILLPTKGYLDFLTFFWDKNVVQKGGNSCDDIFVGMNKKYMEDIYIGMRFMGQFISKALVFGDNINEVYEREKIRTIDIDTEVKTMAAGMAIGELGELGEELGINPEFVFDDATMERIEKIERAQGYNFNTTILKLSIDLRFFTSYQMKILENWGKFNEFYLTGTRRGGKSYFFVYLAIRQLFLSNQIIIYAVPTSEFWKQPMRYFKKFLTNIGKMDKNIRIREDENAIHNDATGSVIWFVTAGAKHGGSRSREATLAISDESSFLPDDEAYSLQTMVSQVRGMQRKKIKFIDQPVGKFIGGSTINKKVPKNWFYRGVKMCEKGAMEDGLSVRASIYQCPFYDDIEREKLIEMYRNDPEALKCELLAEFPSDNTKLNMDDIVIINKSKDLDGKEMAAYNVSNQILPMTKATMVMGIHKYFKDDFKDTDIWLVVGYDPGKKHSNAGVVFTEIYKHKTHHVTKKIVHLGELIIPRRTDYMDQVKMFAELKTYFNKIVKYDRVIFAIDNTGVGEVVSEMLSSEGIEHYKVQYVMKTAPHAPYEKHKPYYNNNGIWYIKKDFLLDMPIVVAKRKLLLMWRTDRLFSDYEDYIDMEADAETNDLDYYNAACVSVFGAVLSGCVDLIYDNIKLQVGTEKRPLGDLIARCTGIGARPGAQKITGNKYSGIQSKFMY